MKNQSPYDLRIESSLGQGLASFTASFMFIRSYVTNPTEPYTIPGWSYLTMSILFLSLAFFFLISPLTHVLVLKSERFAHALWLWLTYISLIGIFLAWIDGVAKLDPSRFWFQWFFWFGLLWLIIFSYHIIRSAWHLGKRLKSNN